MKPHTGGKRNSEICNGIRNGEVRTRMRDLIEDTNKDGKERAIKWCIGNDNEYNLLTGLHIHPYESSQGNNTHGITKTEIGDEESVTSPIANCKQFEKSGSFHTHPVDSLEFSIGDYVSSIEQQDSVSCTGAMIDGSPTTICDFVDLFHEKYPQTRDKILAVYTHEYLNARDNFISSVENNTSLDEIEMCRKIINEYYDKMDRSVAYGIQEGVISRCSVASNMSCEMSCEGIPLKKQILKD